jgi:hypothetical protein
MPFYFDKSLNRIVFKGELTGVDSISFSDGSKAVKSTELTTLQNEIDSDMLTLKTSLDGKSIQVTKRDGQITSIPLN